VLIPWIVPASVFYLFVFIGMGQKLEKHWSPLASLILETRQIPPPFMIDGRESTTSRRAQINEIGGIKTNELFHR